MDETRGMEWEKGSAAACGGERGDEVGDGRGGGCGGTGVEAEGILCVKVMTDEQMEVLRRQIAVYSTICEQLVEMHKAVSAHHDSLAGTRLGGLYGDPLMASGCHKISARQRWTPTTVQLQILENMFNQGNATPSKQKIKEIAVELSQHGQISESNVYNWFQNRRARSKRKQIASLPSNAESEHEADEDSPSEKKSKPNKFDGEDLPAKINDHPLYGVQPYSEAQSLGMHLSNDSSKSSSNPGQISFYDNFLSTPRLDQMMEKYGVPSFSPCCPGESYDIMG